MGMPAQAERYWTAAEVRALIADEPLASPRYELVDGELLVTPSPGPIHQGLVCELLVALRAYCKATRVGVACVSPSDIELESERITQPDVYVLPVDEHNRVIAEGFPARTMLLAIEILSPSSARHDRVTKRPLYQRNVAEYWIVDPEARLVERWRPDDARPEVLTKRLTWRPLESDAGLDIDLAQLFSEAAGS